MKSSPSNILKIAVQAAKKAGKVHMANYGKLKLSQISMKAKNDFVTEVDKKAEKVIIAEIQKYFPGDAIQAEESGLSGGSETLWIIDPLDGTSNYIHHFPAFSVSIGVRQNQKLVAGVVYDALHQELFTATRGQGARLNEKKIQVSSTEKMASAFMATGIPFRARPRFDQYLKSFGIVSMGTAGMRRGGSAALDLAYVACGRFDGFWEINLSPWDIAAGALLIQEAGGKITDMWGKDFFLDSGDVLASNSKIHSELQEVTQSVFTPKN